jgi:prepilin-type N-terminal cleavage/methylation domain-containing protein
MQKLWICIQQRFNQKGSSLIEVLIAMVLMAVAIAGVLTVLPQAYGNITSAGVISTLNHLGQRKIDHIKTMRYADPNLTNGWHPTISPFVEFPHATDSRLSDKYSVRWLVEDNDTAQAGSANVKTIRVEVNYNFHKYPSGSAVTAGSMGQKTVSFQTYITQ